MRGTIVINISDEKDGCLKTSIDMDINGVSEIEALTVVSNLAGTFGFPPDVLPDALIVLNALNTVSERTTIDRALIKQAVDEIGD